MSETLTTSIDGIEFTATLYPAQGKTHDAVLFCLPGGGVTTELFDLAPGYSFKDKMTARRYDVITMDHPGTATNPLPEDHPFLKPRQAAEYIGRAAKAFIGDRPVIGLGHSMGGMMITLAQAKFDLFKAIALLGSSAGGLDWGLTDEEKAYIEKPEMFERDIKALTLKKFGAGFIEYPNSGPSGKSITFGGETPELTARLRDIVTTLYATGGLMSMTRGSFRSEVNAIKVPMLSLIHI